MKNFNESLAHLYGWKIRVIEEGTTENGVFELDTIWLVSFDTKKGAVRYAQEIMKKYDNILKVDILHKGRTKKEITR